MIFSPLKTNLEISNYTLRDEQRRCLHCKDLLPTPEATTSFCCGGCEHAHNLIHKLGFQKFYDYLGAKSLTKPEETYSHQHLVYDNDEFLSSFREKKGDFSEIRLQLLNLSCYACVWVIQKLVERRCPTARIQINLTTGEALLIWPHNTKLSPMIREIEQVGYRVLPQTGQRPLFTSKDLLQLAASWFAFGNIMIFALAEYMSTPDAMGHQMVTMFRWIQGGFASFSLFYGGQGFFTGALAAIKSRVPSLDGPLVVALLATYFYSCFSLWQGYGYIYFDSLAAIIALVLLGRAAFKVSFAKARRKILGLVETSSEYVQVASKEGFQLTPINKVRLGQQIQLLPGELLAVAARLMSDKAEFSLEGITGEPDLKLTHKNEILPAGAVNGNEPVELLTIEDGAASQLSQLKKATESMVRLDGDDVTQTTRVAFWFNICVIFLSAILLSWPGLAWPDALSRVVAVLLVACPCAFGFGAPLIKMRAAIMGLQRGVVFKTPAALTHLGQVGKIFFDKTGTLTQGSPSLAVDIDRRNHFAPSDNQTILNNLAALSRYSSHHSAKALSDWALEQLQTSHFETRPQTPLRNFREDFGNGVSFTSVQGDQFLIGRAKFCNIDQLDHAGDLFICFNHNLLLSFHQVDCNLPESETVIAGLRNEGYGVGIISGDKTEATQTVAKDLGIDDFIAQAKPHDKTTPLTNHQGGYVAMVGNGINDSLALAAATVGITVANASPMAHQAASINLLRPGLLPLVEATKVATAARSAMKRCLAFALAYNGLAATLATIGLISPIIAAVLMPISSLSVMAIALSWRAPQ